MTYRIEEPQREEAEHIRECNRHLRTPVTCDPGAKAWQIGEVRKGDFYSQAERAVEAIAFCNVRKAEINRVDISTLGVHVYLKTEDFKRIFVDYQRFRLWGDTSYRTVVNGVEFWG